MRSSPSAVPAQKNAVSGDTTGRSTAAAADTGPAAPAADGGRTAGGRYLSTRNIIEATGSSVTYQVLLVVTNQPSPSAVRFGPVTSSSTVRTLTCSPCRR